MLAKHKTLKLEKGELTTAPDATAATAARMKSMPEFLFLFIFHLLNEQAICDSTLVGRFRCRNCNERLFLVLRFPTMIEEFRMCYTVERAL